MINKSILYILLIFFCLFSYAQEIEQEHELPPKKCFLYGSVVGGLFNGFTMNFEAPLYASKKGTRLNLRLGAGGINLFNADRGRSTVKGGSLGITLLKGGNRHFFDFSPHLFVGKTSRRNPNIFWI